MANTEQDRQHAEHALAHFRAGRIMSGKEGDGDLVKIVTDLIVDLAHLADTFEGDNETDGDFILHNARDIYDDEYEPADEAPARAESDVEAFTVIGVAYVGTDDLGQTEPDPEVGGAPLPPGVQSDHDAQRSGA